MRVFLLAVMALFASQVAVAGHHEESLKLAKRQATSTMTVTSVQFSDDLTTINATGDMGAYGKVYTTYHLAYDEGRTTGSVTGGGRGVSGDTVIAGTFAGKWERNGSTLIMRNVVQGSNDTQNLDIITFDANTDEMTVEVYVLK